MRSVLNAYPIVIKVDVSAKLPNSVSNFLFSELRIIGRAHVVVQVDVVPAGS
jgi:hypothetical protein